MNQNRSDQERQIAIRTARSLLDLGHSLEVVINSSLIPADLREYVRTQMEREEILTLTPARTLVSRPGRANWLDALDRSAWYYWPALRNFLITTKGWDLPSMRSLDESSEKILQQLASPAEDSFDIRGLVLGFVQSGKTASFTALIAKAADAGYRLIIVLSGTDNGLRRQTNIRLKQELVGYPDNRAGAIRMPPRGKQWHEFTRDDLEGDFQPGFATHAALQGSEPVLLVIKKNGRVLRRLMNWLNSAPPDILRLLPVLIIDDEADQASVDTRGSYQREDEPLDEDYEPPSTINGLIRDLLQCFERKAYVAYTATPFANILIPYDTFDPSVQNDLYPKDFIIDLPKPNGYFGAEEIFGRMDDVVRDGDGLNLIRYVPDEDIVSLEQSHLPSTLESAIYDFILGGAARAHRGQGTAPATMLVHSSHLIMAHIQIQTLIGERFNDIRNEWRYQRRHEIRDRLRNIWENDFRPVTRGRYGAQDVSFEEIEDHIGPFISAIQIRQVNSATGEVLNYQREPSLKAIVIGGNRLSRGLTLEGLIVSYFIRRSDNYDTLMQMGRWFGFRNGYEDLTRIWTTSGLAEWFSDLAFVEHRLREDIKVYEEHGLTPREVGMRIWQHPAMQITSPLKRRYATRVIIEQSYSGQIEQTFKFPFNDMNVLAEQAERNTLAAQDLISSLGMPSEDFSDENGPVWKDISPNVVLSFLRSYQIDEGVSSFSMLLVCAYIEKLILAGELTRWSIGIRGLQSVNPQLGTVEWGGRQIHQIERTRLRGTNSLGIITSPGDETICLTPAMKRQVQERLQIAQNNGEKISENKVAREMRNPNEGLLLLYPISRNSGGHLAETSSRQPIYTASSMPLARDLVGVAISFPKANQQQTVEAYLQGAREWRLME